MVKEKNINKKKTSGLFAEMPVQKRYQLLGELSALLYNSNLYKEHPIKDIKNLFLPPIDLQQFKIFKSSKGDPLAMVLWANMSKDVEKKYLSGTYLLEGKDWNSGNNLWVTHFIDSLDLSKKIHDNLQENEFCDKHYRIVSTSACGMRSIEDFYGKEFKGKKIK